MEVLSRLQRETGNHPETTQRYPASATPSTHASARLGVRAKGEPVLSGQKNDLVPDGPGRTSVIQRRAQLMVQGKGRGEHVGPRRRTGRDVQSWTLRNEGRCRPAPHRNRGAGERNYVHSGFILSKGTGERGAEK